MKVLVLGGGLAGISSALHLNSKFDVELIEQDSRLGGLLRTDVVDGYSYDYGPHLFFHQDPYFIEMFEKSLAKTGIEIRSAKTGQYSFQKLIDFPYAMHLHGLPEKVVSECINDFVQCRIAEAKADFKPQIKNYEDYCRTYFGNGFTNNFMIPYAEKIWSVHPRTLDVDWVGQRIVLPDFKEVIRGAISGRSLAGNYIKDFRYPKTGGTEAFVKGLVAQFQPNVKVKSDTKIIKIYPEKKKVETESGKFLEYDRLISSLPLPELSHLLVDPPSAVRDAISRLKWFGVILLNYGGEKIEPNPYQWIYFDQQDVICHRIHYPSKLSDHMTPGGASQSIQAEISFSNARALPGSDENLTERVWKELKGAGFVHGADVPLKNLRHIEYAYAIMDHERRASVELIRSYLEKAGVVTCGRFGEWDYIWTDKVLQSGRTAAEKLNGQVL